MIYKGYVIEGELRIRYELSDNGDFEEAKNMDLLEEAFVLKDQAGNELEWFDTAKKAKKYIDSREIEFCRLIDGRRAGIAA